MGLFWSMRPSPQDDQYIRAKLPNQQYSYPYTLAIYPGHQTLRDIHTVGTSQPVAQTIIQRLVKAPGVREIPVGGRDTRVRGALLLPPGDGPFPGVISIYGYVPAMKNHRSAMLASHGFASLSLAYYGFEDLPEAGKNLDFEYFEESARWFSSHEAVKGSGIGVLGNCFGGTCAMLMAWKCPEVSVIATLNASPTSGPVGVNRCKQILRKRLHFDPECAVHTQEGVIVRDAGMVSLEDDHIPVWERSVPHLAIVGCDDQQVKPGYAHRVRELCPDDKRHLIQLVHFPGTGHLMDPPYYPFCRSCYFAPFGGLALYGGELKAHSEAQEDAWNKTLDFFSKHLN